ncbi:hypothetical protein FRC03_001581 [Tulasnella sp. 419]|nr:hypothetical protein FRC03_001581 [Tulasnella sp. 419]
MATKRTAPRQTTSATSRHQFEDTSAGTVPSQRKSNRQAIPSKKVQEMAGVQRADSSAPQQPKAKGAKSKLSKAQKNALAKENASRVTAAMSRARKVNAAGRIESSPLPEMRSPPPGRQLTGDTRNYSDSLGEEERMEMEDDPDADLSQEEEMPAPPPIKRVTAGLHKCKADAASKNDAIDVDADEENDEEVEDDDDDDDANEEEDEDNSNDEEDRPAAKRPRFEKPKGTGPNFSISRRGQVVAKSIGRPQHLKNMASRHTRSPSSSAPPPSIISTAPSVSTSGTSSVPRTSTSSKACLRNLDTHSGYLTKEAKHLYRLWIVTEDGFPNATTAVAKAKSIFLDVCDNRGDKVVKKRFKREDSFATEVVNITCLDPESEQSGLYRNPLIADLIGTQWFQKRGALGERFKEKFYPIPLQVIALACTAIHCALLDWAEGRCKAKKNQFEEDVYGPIYQDHIENLREFKASSQIAWPELLQDLWEDVWKKTGEAPSTNNRCRISTSRFAAEEAAARERSRPHA